MTSHNNNLQAITIVCFAYIGFAIADVFSKLLAQDYNVHQILVYTGFIGMIASGVWVVKTLGWKGMIPEKQRKWHVIRAFVVACIPVSVIQALTYMPMADYYGISFCAPFLILMLSHFFLHEKIGLARWIAVMIGFCGVLFIAGPKFEEFGVGLLWACMATLFVSLSVFTVRKIGPGAPRPHYIFFPFVATFFVNLIALSFVGEYAVPPLDDAWKFIALITFVIIGQLGFAVGHSKASEAAVTAPFLYTMIIWGVLLGWFVFGDIPTINTWIGLVIIIGAGLYSVWREYRMADAIDLTREV